MSAGDTLRELARFLDDVEAARGVGSVAVGRRPDPGRGGPFDVTVTLDDRASVEVREAAVDADRRLSLALATSPLLPAGHDVTVDDATARVDPEGALVVDLSVRVPSDEGGTGGGARGTDAGGGDDADDVDGGDDGDDGAESGDGGAERGSGVSRDRGVPAFRDRERLAAAYDSCTTFAEMRDALGVDVSPETVRRYMIDAGVHQPASYDTGGSETGDDGTNEDRTDEDATGTGDAGDGAADGDETDDDATADGDETDDDATADGGATDGATDDAVASDDERPVVLADGVGLPEGVTPGALVDAVAAAATTYEVERRLGLDREETLATLRACDLLDLVAGRLGTAAEREVDREAVRERLRRAADARSR
jgi:hypothetical protein